MNAIAEVKLDASTPVEDRLLGKEAESRSSLLYYQLSIDLFGELSDRSASGSPKNPSAKVKPLPDPLARKRSLYRKGFNIAIQKASLHITERLGIPDDDSLVPLIGKGEEHSNYEVIVRRLNREVNRAMGKDGSNSDRSAWSIQEFREARLLIRRVRDTLLEELGQELHRSRQLLLELGPILL